MGPKWQGTVSFHFEEEYRLNRMNSLYKVFTNEKTADNKLWASANPSNRIRTVTFIKGKCDR